MAFRDLEMDEVRDLSVDRSSICSLSVIVSGALGLRELFNVSETSISHRLHCPPLDDHPALHCLVIVFLGSKLLVGFSD
jgi:hypothetical protein